MAPVTEWTEVTNETQCPICAGSRRCKIAPDGKAVPCFRSAEEIVEWRVTKKHVAGLMTVELRNIFGAYRNPIRGWSIYGEVQAIS